MHKRTAHKSKIEYENTWNEALTIIEKNITNKDKTLGEILHDYYVAKICNRFKKKFFRDFHKSVGINIKRRQPPKERLVVTNNKYTIVPLEVILDYSLIDILANFIHEKENQIDYVVELGSGFGINLFILASKLDPSLRRRIGFFSCEFTDSGKKVCEKVLSLSDGLQISIEHFDYYHPDFSFLPPKKNCLFFTAHSIEQIPIVDRVVFERMLEVSDQCHCYHAEPVGWQYDENLQIQRRHLKPNHWKRNQSYLRRKLFKLDRWMFSKFGVGIVNTSQKYGINIEKTDIGKPDKVSTNAAMWSLCKDYNANLISIIKNMETEGLIAIDTEIVNLYGKNPFNPTSIISWHKITN